MVTSLNKMDFVQYIKYLDNKGIKYTTSEEVDIDVWFTVLTIVKPISKKLKERYFDNDGGMQLL